MRKIRYTLFFMLFGVLAFAQGCDSDGDGGSDSSVMSDFAGTWRFNGFSDGNGDLTETFEQDYNSVVIIFTEAGSITLNVDAVDDASDASYSGTYIVNEGASSLIATLTVFGQPTALTFNYNFIKASTLTLTATGNTGILLGLLFGSSLVDPVTINLISV